MSGSPSSLAALPAGKNPGTVEQGGWMSRRDGVLEKTPHPCWDSNPGSSTLSVAIMSEMCCLFGTFYDRVYVLSLSAFVSTLSVFSLQPPKPIHVSRSRSCGVCHRRYGHSVATLLLLWLQGACQCCTGSSPFRLLERH